MRNFMMALAVAGLVVPPVALTTPTKAEAKHKKYRAYTYTRNGKTYCRHSDGTTGLIVGGVGAR